VSPAWKSEIGAGKSVKWPTGVGGKGSAGIAAYLLPTVSLKNRAGSFVRPSGDSFAAAAAGAKWDAAQGFYINLTNQPGENTWPIVGGSFILIPAHPTDAARAKEVLNFFDYAFDHGSDVAAKLHYVALPSNLIGQIRQSWSAIKGQDGQPIWR
jgi:phosphate transport system substrate-binding protein